MRTMPEDWNNIRERLKAAHSPQRFEDYKDNPMVQGLIRFINSNLNASLEDVNSWYIEATESDEKAFIVQLANGKKYIGTLAPNPDYVLVGKWSVIEWTHEDLLMDEELTSQEKLLLEVHKLGVQFSALQAQICDALLIGLQTDGAHHKQWALWRIAEIASVDHLLSDIEDRGIKP